jgi:hypothetical protein
MVHLEQAAEHLRNPHTGRDEWYHGTQAHKEDLAGGFVDPTEFAPGRFEEPEGEGDDPGHWNRLLGNHFTADHDLADEFAQGEHSGQSNEGYGEDREEHQGIVHARLKIHNPKHYASEHDMDHEAYEHEYAAGNHPINHLHQPENEPEDEEDFLHEYWPNAMRIHHDYGTSKIPEGTYGHYLTPFEGHPMRTAWLNTHPDKYGIAERFKQRLMDQGHDGVTYGNEYEKSRYGRAGNTSAIAFHPDHQIEVTEHHHVDEPCRTEPHARTAAATSHETWYHLTDNPHFKLDPGKAPQDNSMIGGGADWSKGVFLGKSPEYWLNAHNYVRPYVAEVHADPQVHQEVDTHKGTYPGEAFVPGSHFHRLHVNRVIPLDAYAREEFGEHGWIESHHGTEFDTGNPIPHPYQGSPFKEWNEPSHYRYPGPDVRDMPKEETDRHKERWLGYLKENRGFDDEDIEHYRQHTGAANDPWGGQNTVAEVPPKPYGATSPPQKDMDPGSYGPLAGPDPENWGQIDEDSAIQQPISTDAARAGPDTGDWVPERQEGFPFTDQAPAAGPSTSITPHDPQGIKMEEGLQATARPRDPWRDPMLLTQEQKSHLDRVQDEEAHSLHPESDEYEYVWGFRQDREHEKHRRHEMEMPGDRDYMHDKLRTEQGHNMAWHYHDEGWKPPEHPEPGSLWQAPHYQGVCKDCGANVMVGAHGSSVFRGGKDARNTPCSGPGTGWQDEMLREHQHNKFSEALGDYRHSLKDIEDRQWLRGQGFEAMLWPATAAAEEPYRPGDTDEDHYRDYHGFDPGDSDKLRSKGIDPAEYHRYMHRTHGEHFRVPHEHLTEDDRAALRDMGIEGALAADTGELKDEPEPALDEEGLTADGNPPVGGGNASANDKASLATWASLPDEYSGKPVSYIPRPNSKAELMDHLGAGHGITYSGDREPGTRFLLLLHDRFHDELTAARREGDHQHEVPRGSHDPVFGARDPDEPTGAHVPQPGSYPLDGNVTGGGPGVSPHDEDLSPSDVSIQTMGQQQWSGGGADSDEVAIEPGQPQGNGSEQDVVSRFQASAAARQYASDGPGAAQAGAGDIAAAAQSYLRKEADVLPAEEASALIAEGRGQRARNLDLLDLQGTHYVEEDEELRRRGISLDNYDDDVVTLP